MAWQVGTSITSQAATSMHALEPPVVLCTKAPLALERGLVVRGERPPGEDSRPWLTGGANLRQASAVHYAIPCETHYTIRLRSKFRLPSPPPYSPVREFIP